MIAIENNNTTIPCLIFGASGYTGAELARLINSHPKLAINGLFVSESSKDNNKKLSDIHPQLNGLIDIPLISIGSQEIIKQLKILEDLHEQIYVFLATPHEFSHDIAPLIASDSVTVFDLSGAYRLKESEHYSKYYNFVHKHSQLLSTVPYALSEWLPEHLEKATLISLPGCYPTAAQLALKPLVNSELIDTAVKPVINAISGATGAGRKANLNTSFCELSLKPYNIFKHRHTPEIEQGLGISVLFTPHIAAFKRGILATINVRLKTGVGINAVNSCYESVYSKSKLVRLKSSPPAIDDVAFTPFCDLHWELDGQDLIIISAIDNLLKGAASQAIEVANAKLGLPTATGLIGVEA